MAEADVIVVGSGIVGSFTALALHKAGFKVMVADRGGLAAGTSRASDGNLLMSDKDPGVLFDLARRSLELWDETIAELGNRCEYAKKGSTVVVREAGQLGALRTHVEAHAAHGVACEVHDAGLSMIEPHLAPEIRGLGWWRDDAQVQPMLACYQIAETLTARGVVYRFYDEILGIETTPVGAGVSFAGGDVVAAGHVCLCTGVWTNALLEAHGVELPLRPRKGQICVLERGAVEVRTKIADFAYNATVDQAPAGDGVAQTAAIIEATQSGTILCGSSRAFAGFDRSLDYEVLARIMTDCIAIVPALADLRVIRAYAGLRPWSADGLPIIGAVDAHGRLLVATGHEGTGHALAPITGEIVADRLAGRANRFAGWVTPERFEL